MRRWLLFALLIPCAHGQTIGSGVTLGSGVTVGLPPFVPPPSGFVFTPSAGTYTGAQNITITHAPAASGKDIFYTTSGLPANPASTLYSSAVPISISGTINALAETVGSVRQETQNLPDIGNNTSVGWKFCTPLFSSSNGTPTSGNSSQCGGGVTGQPSTWSITPGSGSTPEIMSISGTSGAPQFLYTLGGKGCDSCTKITQDKCVMPVSGSNMMNYEMDAWDYDGTRKRLHMHGLQCNQQPGKLQWQVDNEQGSWQNTGITDGCPLSSSPPANNGCPSGYTHVVYEGHWVIGDTGCGGLGCDHYDKLTINGNVHVINMTLESDNPNWASSCSQQDQLDLNNVSSGTKTSGEKIIHNNVTCSTGTVDTGAAAYTIH